MASTRTYVEAARVLAGDLVENVTAGHLAADALVASVRAECPDVLSGAPDEDNRTVGSELTELVLLELERPDFPAVRAFLHRTRSLHWDSRTIERHVGRRAASLRAELAVQPPTVCADLRLWAGSGFKVIPAGAVAFVHSFERAQAEEAVNNGLVELLDLMSAHEARSLKRIVQSVHRQADRFANALLPVYLDAVAELFKAVGAPPALSTSAGL